ncbi:MAG TPA: dihydrofolate reductase [Allosphingosinicella sp.]
MSERRSGPANPDIVLVVARADNGVIGRGGRLPWHLPQDLRHFKRVTIGAPMIMGRRTFDSLPGILPGRRHIVITRDRSWRAPDVEVAATPDEALQKAASHRVSVIGGAEIFRLFEPIADSVELTELHFRPNGDTILPPFDPGMWREVTREDHSATEGGPAFSFVRLERASR